MTWVLVFTLFFAGDGQTMDVRVNGLVSKESCEQAAEWFVTKGAARAEAGGAKWHCEEAK